MAEINQKPQRTEERRADARVQDAIALEIERLHEIPAAGEPSKPARTKQKVRRANKYDIEGYADVKRDYPAVAQYVAELEERIRQLSMGGVVSSESPTHKVSLSAGGMAFAHDLLMYPGEQVGVSITLFPSLKRIQCDARIVSAGDAPEVSKKDLHTYRLNFVRISDADRAIIENHVQTLLRAIPKKHD